MTPVGAMVRLLAGLGLVATLGVALAGPAAAGNPVVEVTPADVAPGDAIRLELNGWPESVVTAQVCGNGARRGSSDCDQIGAESIRVPASGHEYLRVNVLEPPVGCPCVVRISTARGDIVRTVPITVAGISGGVDIPPVEVSPAASAVRVRAVVEPPNGLVGRIRAAFGLDGRRTLTVTVANGSSVAATGLRFAGTIGRPGRAGDPFAGDLADAAPGVSTTTRLTFTVPFPPLGDAEVRGTVVGLDVPVPVGAATSSDPWALELLLPVALLVTSRIARVRSRRSTNAAPQVSTDCSPVVGVADDPHWGSSPYDREPVVTDLPGAPESVVQVPQLELV